MSLPNQSFKSSLQITLFQSLSFCGLRSKILKNIAFQPPPVSYHLRQRNKLRCRQSLKEISEFIEIADLRKKSQSYEEESLIEELDLYHLQEDVKQTQTELNCSSSNQRRQEPIDREQYPVYDFFLIDDQNNEIPIPPQDTLSINGYFLPWKKNHKFASIFLKAMHPNSDYVLLFSHGNASDLGLMIDTLIGIIQYLILYLCNNLRINVFAYEYPGYGQSSGSPSDINVIKCIQIAYEFLVQQLQFNPTKIIVYGYSIGSGPSVTLVSDSNYTAGGLVIHSGLSSGLRVVKQQLQKTPFYDIFPNIDRIKNVQCPVFILHGTDDEVIGLEHAKNLAGNCQRLAQFWEVSNIGHSGIDTDSEHRKEYFYRLRHFVKMIYDENDQLENLFERNKASPTMKQTKHYYDNKLKILPIEEQIEKQKKISEKQKQIQLIQKRIN